MSTNELYVEVVCRYNSSIPITILEIVLVFLPPMLYLKFTQTLLNQCLIQQSGQNIKTVIAYSDIKITKFIDRHQ